MSRIEKHKEPLSAYAAACALDPRDSFWLVVTIGQAWHYIYPTCATESLPFMIDLAKAAPLSFMGFRRGKPACSKWWNRDEVKTWSTGYPCAVCGKRMGDHP